LLLTKSYPMISRPLPPPPHQRASAYVRAVSLEAPSGRCEMRVRWNHCPPPPPFLSFFVPEPAPSVAEGRPSRSPSSLQAVVTCRAGFSTVSGVGAFFLVLARLMLSNSVSTSFCPMKTLLAVFRIFCTVFVSSRTALFRAWVAFHPRANPCDGARQAEFHAVDFHFSKRNV
jgi:hypothetical protein